MGKKRPRAAAAKSRDPKGRAIKRKHTKSRNPKAAKTKKFRPGGKGYDSVTAKRHGLKPNAEGRLGSIGAGGLVLKGRGHSGWDNMAKMERSRGSLIVKKLDDRYYTVPARHARPAATVANWAAKRAKKVAAKKKKR